VSGLQLWLVRLSIAGSCAFLAYSVLSEPSFAPYNAALQGGLLGYLLHLWDQVQSLPPPRKEP
jgi:hypothetical protein